MSNEHPTIRHVRLYVDGELTPNERAAFERRLADDETLRQQVEFERTLRQHVVQLMSDQAPAGLAEAVAAAMRRETPDDQASPAARITPEGVTTRRSWTRWLAEPRRANIAAVAASLALVTGAVLWGIFGPPIDSVQHRPDVVTEAATFIAAEHTRCAVDEVARSGKAQLHELQAMQNAFAAHLGHPPAIPDLEPLGYELYGGGRCAVPGQARSVHVLYRRPPSKGRPAAMVSLFAVPNYGQFEQLEAQGLAPDRWYEVPTAPTAPHRVDCTTDGALVYFLVCCDDRDVPGVAGVVGGSIMASMPPG